MNRRTLIFLAALVAAPIFSQASSEEKLPNVLIIGDSISIGYTPFVKENLKKKAVVIHNPGNGKYSAYGLKKLDEWIGEKQWDVIHFNWGLWDLCYRDPNSKNPGHRDKVNGKITASLEQYEKNLEKLVTRLEKTGATLIWANTTIVPKKETGRKVGDDLKYNQVAAKVMKRHGIVIDDLNTLTRTFSSSLFLGEGNVHYTKDGYKKLAKQVTDHILTALKK